jgi:phenylacetate-coenzyme A ligase PaaK-like adenylate-forming protein
MRPTWDHRSASALVKLRNTLVRDQIRHVVGPFSPFYRERFSAAGIKATSVGTVGDLARLPAVGERDLSPDGDPARAAALVVQGGHSDYALHAHGPELRKALRRRVTDISAYRRQVESDTRPTSFTFAGLGFTFPLASTRSDLDIVARAGARLWQVLGLSAADSLVAAMPPESTPSRVALEYAALAARSPALFVGADATQVAATLRLVPATVLAVAAESAAALVDDLADLGAPLDSLTTLLLVGAPSPAEREAVRQSLTLAGRGSVIVLAVHGPSGARVLWGECRESATAGTGSAGFHTYPDLDVVDVVEPETGGDAVGDGPAELVLTQLGLKGSALVRWRTGDLVEAGIQAGRCPSCMRMVPRVSAALARGGLVPSYAPNTGRSGHVDVRSMAGVLVGRPDLVDWRVVIRTSARHGADQLLVHVAPAPGSDPADLVVAAARDLRAASGRLPSQLVAATPDELRAIDRAPDLVRLTPRISVRS